MRIEERLMTIAHSGAGWVMWLLIVLSVAGFAVVLDRAMSSLDRTTTSSGSRRSLLAARRWGNRRRPFALVRVSVVRSQGGRGGVCRSLTVARRPPRNAWRANAICTAGDGAAAQRAGHTRQQCSVRGALGYGHRHHSRVSRARESGGQMSARLMSEIGEALAATAVGLLVALPSVAFFNIFHGIISARISTRRRARARALGTLEVATRNPAAPAGA